jgi:hypothetical protein
VAFVGFILSFGIRSSDLEAQGWNSDDDDEEDEEQNKSDDEESTP